MFKVFVIREQKIFMNAVRFIETNWEAMSRAGKCLVIECKEEKAKRSNEANRYYWQLLHQVEEQAWIEGRQYSAEVWHEAAKRRFIGCVDLPGGGTMAMSSADLNVQEFADYTTKVEAWAQTELGVCLMDLSEPHGRVA